jgi:hypothetical protein
MYVEAEIKSCDLDSMLTISVNWISHINCLIVNEPRK